MSNVSLLRELYEAFARGDVETIFGTMDPQMEWHEAEGNPYDPGGPFVGLDSIGGLFMRLATEWDGFTVQPKEFYDAGDTVVVEGRYSGTHKQTGKALDAQMCHVVRFRDGKAISFQQYVDTAQLQDVMAPS